MCSWNLWTCRPWRCPATASYSSTSPTESFPFLPAVPAISCWPWRSIASYALLTVMIAHVTGLKPGTLYITHTRRCMFINHVSALKEQCDRDPRPFPTIHIKRKVVIEEFIRGLRGQDYNPQHLKIAMEMAVLELEQRTNSYCFSQRDLT